MSMMLTAKAMSIKVGNPIRKLVLLKLADQANDKGECWPSYKSIAEGAECSEHSAMAHIDWLEKNGFLRVEERAAANGRTMTNIYHLTLEKRGESPAPGGESPAPYEGESPAPKPVNNQSYNQSYNQSMNQYDAHAEACACGTPVLPDTPNVFAEAWNGNGSEPPAEPKPAKLPKTKPEALAFDLLRAHGVSVVVAQDYLALRKSHRAPLTETALAGIRREADKANLTLEQALSLCCERGWRGFCADWLLKDAPYSGHAPKGRQNNINRVPQHTKGGAHLAKDIL